MRSSEDPAFLTAEQRLSELAAILAAGTLRLKARAAIPDAESGVEIPANSQLCESVVNEIASLGLGDPVFKIRLGFIEGATP